MGPSAMTPLSRDARLGMALQRLEDCRRSPDSHETHHRHRLGRLIDARIVHLRRLLQERRCEAIQPTPEQRDRLAEEIWDRIVDVLGTSQELRNDWERDALLLSLRDAGCDLADKILRGELG